MATIRIPISGRSKSLAEAMKAGTSLVLVLETPAEDGDPLLVSVLYTPPGGSLETISVGEIEQSKIQGLLNPTGGSYAAAVAAALVDVVADFNTRYNTLETAVIAATGAGEQAAVTALLATGQTDIATIIDDAVDAANAVFA